jgi:pyruvate dehydrogenase E2 component (dihydrolipoamide acetyltransferase)
MPVTILMPALSPTMTEGALAKWLKKEGEKVEAGDIIAEIETDKATMEIEALDDGTIGKLLVAEGEEGIAVNAPIAVILEEGEDASALGNIPDTAPPAAQAPVPAEPVPAAPVEVSGPPPATATTSRIAASPLARRMAKQAAIDLAELSGSGPNGRIIKVDVERAIASPGERKSTRAPSATLQEEVEYRDVPNSAIRKVIAKRLSEAKRDIPHFYLTIDCRIDRLLALRKELNAHSAPQEEDSSYRLSVNDFVIRASALALKRVPEANASWTDEAIRLYGRADVAVAVATPKGLFTPVIRDAANKGLAVISNEIRSLAKRARDGQLAPEEYQGGGFTISNLGMFGIKAFSAIINPPQACLLAVGAGEQRPVVTDGDLGIATVMTCTLSVDHRAVDGALGAQFLGVFKDYIESPLTMLLQEPV